ncbi:class II fructose-bisphosphate aldolase [Clostridium sp. AM58-1XD]|uniref:class II fructose-bisphosphate aldolase n=1 Tax=Clostridium sp. AM58-1XD TaxID=2292307 RepID=UPI000E5411BB|nr:class II fructose-bisphosphate aldolase [Clostridium sp. AM58-1XD]RGZ01596.1 class II fructose-bisphosphate aldolase [Clostridium sp. AM58-1XD]
MAVVNSKNFYRNAFTKPYAIGGFQAYNMEMIQGIVEAAAAKRSPVLVQSSCRGVRYAGAETIFHITRLAAEKYRIPVVLHLDHGDSTTLCREAVDAGFTSVMLDCTDEPTELAIEKTRDAAAYAHEKGASVEGEIAVRGEWEEIWMTAVPDAVRFVKETRCDSLSICVGNSHALYGRGFPDDKKPCLNLKLLRQIHEALPDMPLVLHSISTGTDELDRRMEAAGGKITRCGVFTVNELKEAMKLGVVKCNVGINKIATTVGIREYLRDNPYDIDPRAIYGAGKQVMVQAIKDHMEHVFFSAGQLDER